MSAGHVHAFAVQKDGAAWVFSANSVHWGTTALVQFGVHIGPLYGECALSIAEGRALALAVTAACDEAQAAQEKNA